MTDKPVTTIVKVYGVVLGELPDEGMVTVIIKGRPIQFNRNEVSYIAVPGCDASYTDVSETL